MGSRQQLIAAVHSGRRRLGLDEETYRALLERVTNRRSCADLDDRELGLVLDELRALGFRRPDGTQAPPRSRSRPSAPLVRKIHALWNAMVKSGAIEDGSRAALRAYVKRQTGIGDPEWLDTVAAARVVESLKQWSARVAAGGAPSAS